MKKNFRLNWVDLLILVLMVGLVAGTYMKFRVSKTTNVVEPQTPITYQVQITNIRKTTVDALREGDALFDDDSGRKIGTIRSIEATPALTLAVDTEGVYHMTETDDRYDVILTVETKEGSISGPDLHPQHRLLPGLPHQVLYLAGPHLGDREVTRWRRERF